MSRDITFTIAEISKLNLQPGDTLSVKIISDEIDENDAESLREKFKSLFPNNKIFCLTVPRGSDIQLEVIKSSAVTASPEDAQNRGAFVAQTAYAAMEAKVAKDCSVPTNYCNDCACGKKERILAESEYNVVDEVQETIDSINNGTYKPDQE